MKIYKEPIIYDELEQRSEEWFSVRKGVFSGSSMKSALGGEKAQNTLSYEMVAELHIDNSVLPEKYNFEQDWLQEKILSGSKLNASDILKRGAELEDKVVEIYEEKTGYTVEEVGFVKIHDRLGCSPDGLISEGGEYIGAIEIKCPMGTNFIKYLYEGKDDEICYKEYEGQIKNYFICLPQIKFVDFMIYHPGASKELGNFHMMRIHRKDIQPKIDSAFIKIEGVINHMYNIEDKIFKKLKK